jgi:hypothetical protein
MRGLLLGLLIALVLTVTVLSLRPGGIRRQLRFAARRLRIALVLGGIFIAASTVIRLAFPQGWVADYGPSVVAAVLAVTFLALARDPVNASEDAPGHQAGEAR